MANNKTKKQQHSKLTVKSNFETKIFKIEKSTKQSVYDKVEC